MFGYIYDAMIAAGGKAEDVAAESDPVQMHLDGGEPACVGVGWGDFAGDDYLQLVVADYGEGIPHPEIGGALLFGDGWALAMEGEARVAYTPSADPVEKKRVMILYLERRRAILMRECDYCRSILVDPRADALPTVCVPYRDALEDFERDVAECCRKLEEVRRET